VVGALVNLGLGLALMFWPSGNAEHSLTIGRSRGKSMRAAAALRRRLRNRLARVSNGEFGGRGG